jgi:hypothetical protein
MPLGKKNAGIMRLLRATCHPDEERAWPAPSKLVQSMPHEEKSVVGFLLMTIRESRCG